MVRSRQQILIIEDNADFRRFVRAALVVAGFDVVESGDGVRALQRIDADPPDLVILDPAVASVRQFGILDEVVTYLEARRIPMMVVTDAAIPNREAVGRFVLLKPVTPDRLVRAVRECLLSRGRAARS